MCTSECVCIWQIVLLSNGLHCVNICISLAGTARVSHVPLLADSCTFECVCVYACACVCIM